MWYIIEAKVNVPLYNGHHLFKQLVLQSTSLHFSPYNGVSTFCTQWPQLRAFSSNIYLLRQPPVEGREGREEREREARNMVE